MPKESPTEYADRPSVIKFRAGLARAVSALLAMPKEVRHWPGGQIKLKEPMMTSPYDVPKSIIKAAQDAQDAAAEECKSERFFYGFGSGHAKEVLDRHIALAILAEREACARIADALVDVLNDDIADTNAILSRHILSTQRHSIQTVADAIRRRTSAEVTFTPLMHDFGDTISKMQDRKTETGN